MPVQDIDEVRSTLQDCIAVKKLVLFAKTTAEHRHNRTNLVWTVIDSGTLNPVEVVRALGSQATASTSYTGYNRSYAFLAKKSHCSLFPRLFCLDWTTVTHCWSVYHATCRECSCPSGLNLGFHDHVTSALQQLHWLSVKHRIKYKLCMAYQIHTERAPQYLTRSTNLYLHLYL